MISAHLPVLQVVLPLIAAPLCVIIRQGTISWLIATVISCVSFIISVLLLNQVLNGDSITYAIGGWAAPWGIEYYLDKLTAFMLLIVNAVAALVMLGARASVISEIAADRRYLFYVAFLLNLTGLLGVLMTGDAFNLFVFIEIASLSSYAMISVGSDRRCLYAAFRYLILGTVGASFILIAVGLLYIVTGTLNIADLYARLPEVSNRNTVLIALVFFSIGIAIKAALFPLHLWLPDAYSYSPSVVTTFLAGTTTKVFVYVLVRFIYSLFGYDFVFEQSAFHTLLMFSAGGAVLFGSFLAIKQDKLKRLLAYSSVAQTGYMILGIAIATETGLTAGLAHVFNHAIIKVALFLSVLNIIYRYKTDSIQRLAGLAKTMPVTTACFLVSGLSLIGVPLTAGFTGKWLLIKASFAGSYWGLVVLIVVSSIMAILYIWKVVEIACFRAPSAEISDSRRNNSQSYLFYISLFAFVSANIYFGLETSINIGLPATVATDFMTSL